MNRLRVGIYGVRRAMNIMRRGLAGNLAQIVAVTDPDAELVRNASDEISSLGAAAYTEFGRFLGVGLDAVIIAGPPGRQASPAIKALRHGIDVLCYPMPVSMLDEAFLLERTVREGGCVFAFAEPYCYRRGVMTAREMYRNGDIGRPVGRGDSRRKGTAHDQGAEGRGVSSIDLYVLGERRTDAFRDRVTSSPRHRHGDAARRVHLVEGG